MADLVRIFCADHRLFRPFYRYIVALDTATWGQLLDRDKDFIGGNFFEKKFPPNLLQKALIQKLRFAPFLKRSKINLGQTFFGKIYPNISFIDPHTLRHYSHLGTAS
jgi:hypothetical protein